MTGPLAGKHILVVEDEYFIASDLKQTLAAEGAQVVGPAGDLQKALSLAEGPMDAALLDVNLQNDRSYPIADRLQERHIPYIFLTGYDSWALPSEHQQTPRLSKPFTPRFVVTMLEQLLSPHQETI